MEARTKWGFWKRWRWKLRAFRYMGIIAFFFPYGDGGFAHVVLGSFYTASTPLLAESKEERAKAPLLEEIYLLAGDIIEPYLYGGERSKKRGSVEKVYAEAEKMFSYLKELEQREPYAAWLLREIIAGYLADIATAFAFLYKIEKRKEFCRLQEFFEHLMYAFGDCDEEKLRLAREAAKESSSAK
jgi:formate/nitrite transporter FocA (FNT family)